MAHCSNNSNDYRFTTHIVSFALGSIIALIIISLVNIIRGNQPLPFLSGTLRVLIVNMHESRVDKIFVFDSTDLAFIDSLSPGDQQWVVIHPTSTSDLYVAYSVGKGAPEIRMVNYYSMWTRSEAIRVDILPDNRRTFDASVVGLENAVQQGD
jgi:hypothetical protein